MRNAPRFATFCSRFSRFESGPRHLESPANSEKINGIGKVAGPIVNGPLRKRLL
jgi:hypothetical protein